MAFRIKPKETVTDAVQRIAVEQIENALAEIDDSDLNVHETIHQVRKRCKKIRGVIRLVRPAMKNYSAENAWFRDAARKLSDLRDATTLLECFDALMERYKEDVNAESYAPVRDILVKRRNAVAEAQDLDERLDAFREMMEAGRERVKSWKIKGHGYDAVSGGLKKTYKRSRKAMDSAYADPAPERFHEWRKRVKYNRYHTRLIRELWPEVLRPLRDEVKRLSDRLGEDHDLAVLREILVSEEARFGSPQDHIVLLSLIDNRRKELQAWAHPLGRRLYAEEPKRYARRLGRCWKAWTSEQKLNQALADEAAELYS